jgi:hypothetical protein
MSLTDKQIADALALDAKATPGPWASGMNAITPVCDDNGGWWAAGPCHDPEDEDTDSEATADDRAREKAEADTEFIAAARTGWPEALRELQAARAEIAGWRKGAWPMPESGAPNATVGEMAQIADPDGYCETCGCPDADSGRALSDCRAELEREREKCDRWARAAVAFRFRADHAAGCRARKTGDGDLCNCTLKVALDNLERMIATNGEREAYLP